MNLSDLDADFASAPSPSCDSRKRAPITPEQFAALAAQRLPCGFYTLTLTDGSRKRFRVRLERGTFLTNQRTLSRYCKIGADNDVERDWETIAVVGPNGFSVFKRWRGEWEERWAWAMWMLAHGFNREAPGYALEIEPRCWLCMRELTTEDAKKTGLTKSCKAKVIR